MRVFNTETSCFCQYLWVESRICSLLCAASPPPGDQSGGNSRLFHLREGGKRNSGQVQRDEIRLTEQRDRNASSVTQSGETVSCLTFIYVRGQTSHKHLAGEALNAFPVLVGVTAGGAQDPGDTLVAVAIVEEIVINREEGGAAWWEIKKN